MKIGFLTAPFHDQALDEVVRFASKAGFSCLELICGPGSRHIDTSALDEKRADEIRRLFDQSHLSISSLAAYTNPLDPDPQKREETLSHLRAAVDAAKLLGVDVVCTLAGFPMPGKNKLQTIEQDVPGVFGPLCEYAGERGIKIALENWYATNIQNLEHFQRIFEAVPSPNFGLNYDPSHLVHQQIDYIEAVEVFASRIFHSHAKDTEIRHTRLRWVGNQAGGWWRYVIPGFGEIHWGRYIGALRRAGFDGAVSIEHEDGAWGREDGMVKGLENLRLHVG